MKKAIVFIIGTACAVVMSLGIGIGVHATTNYL
jgi:hypothetical protein